jgi:hypothetical protein
MLVSNIQCRRVVRPWLGLKMLDLNPMIIAQLKEKSSTFPDVRKGVLVPMVSYYYLHLRNNTPCTMCYKRLCEYEYMFGTFHFCHTDSDNTFSMLGLLTVCGFSIRLHQHLQLNKQDFVLGMWLLNLVANQLRASKR